MDPSLTDMVVDSDGGDKQYILMSEARDEKTGATKLLPHSDAKIEADSFHGSGDSDNVSTMSTDSYVWRYHEENGRTYHSYRAGGYHWPNDPTEAERLDYQHWVLDLVLQGILHFAPLVNPLNMLDIGTGTGTWVIQMGDAYPGAIVEGTDLSPIQPNDVPDNVRFVIDDAEEEDWAVPEDNFDFVHTRVLMGALVDFGAMVKRAFKYTKPGGWMESQDVMMYPYCDDGSMPEDWPFARWSRDMAEAAEIAGRSLCIAARLKEWFIEAGFVDVHEKVVKIPINSWPRDPFFKLVGSHWAEDLLAGLQGFSLALFSRVFGWSKTEIEVYLIDVRKSLLDPRVHAYHRYYVVWGRKPGNSPKPLFTDQHEFTFTVPSESAKLLHPADIPLPESPPHE